MSAEEMAHDSHESCSKYRVTLLSYSSNQTCSAVYGIPATWEVCTTTKARLKMVGICFQRPNDVQQQYKSSEEAQK